MSGRSTETLASFVPRVAKKSNSRRNWHGKAAAFNVKKSCQKSVRNFGRRDPLRRRRLGRLRFRLRRRRDTPANSLSPRRRFHNSRLALEAPSLLRHAHK